MKRKKAIHNVVKFLYESNAIENVWEESALDKALIAWKYLIDEKTITLENILKTHRLLMDGLLSEDDRGKLRRVQVWVGGREGKPWHTLPELMEEWIKKANKGLKLRDGKEYFCQQMHVEFEKIHPFLDGNGRLGRMLWQKQRVDCGLPIKIIYEIEKYKYYKLFE